SDGGSNEKTGSASPVYSRFSSRSCRAKAGPYGIDPGRTLYLHPVASHRASGRTDRVRPDQRRHGPRIPPVHRRNRSGDTASGQRRGARPLLGPGKGRIRLRMLPGMRRRTQPDARNAGREMKARFRMPLAMLALAWAGLSQEGLSVLPGSPLRGITPIEQELFRLGLEDFTEVETAEDGLGPAFNGTSCASCHSVPAIGGISSIAEVRGGYLDGDGRFTALNGGTLYHLFSTPPHTCQVRMPPQVNVIARRV